MITGLNTSVEHGQQTYHVQTEDCGLDNPVIESTIYLGGAILGSKKTSYREFLQGESIDEKKLRQMLELQHYAIVRAIRSGRVAARWRKRKVEETRRVQEAAPARPHVELLSNVLDEEATGRPYDLCIRIVETTNARPVAHTEVSVEVFGGSIKPQRLKGKTDEDGYLNLTIDLPQSHRVAAAMLFRVDRPRPDRELKVLVVQSPPR